MERNKKGQFIRGTNGNTYDGFGIWYDKKGYPTIWINNKSIKLHIYVWEKKNGEKPKEYDLHHKDNNKGNYDIDNLELLSISDHKKTHAKWIKKNNEWYSKPCKICKKQLPLDKFYERKTVNCPSNVCIECTSVFYKEKLKNDFQYREKKRLYLKNYYKKNKDTILKKQKKCREEAARG